MIPSSMDMPVLEVRLRVIATAQPSIAVKLVLRLRQIAPFSDGASIAD